MEIDGKTCLYGIIGDPVAHSLSPVMHNGAFSHLGENCVYLPFAVQDVAAAMQGIRSLSIKGVSITIPHKESVIPYLDMMDPVAEKIGAVNTIHCVEQDGNILLCGSNTDWIGANRALAGKTQLKGSKVVILGAGGSARAIGFGLLESGAEIILCSRTESRGRQLAEDLGCRWCPLDHAETLVGDVLVNATSVGMGELKDKSPVPAEVTRHYAVVMDIVYAPLKTRLLQEAEQAGCEVINGLEMLLYQGVAQFELWTGLQAPVDIMRDVLLKATGNR